MCEDDIHIVKGFSPLSPIPDIPVGKLIYDQLIANCSDDDAFVDAISGESLSYKRLLAMTCCLAESLRRSGYNENTKISISSENSIEFFIPVIAAMYLGATVVPISQNYTRSEILHALNISKSQIIFCSKQVYPKFTDLKTKLNFIDKIVVIEDDGNIDNAETIQSFILKFLRNSESLYRFNINDVDIDNQVALILYSSGTTGLPKGVMITQRNILAIFSFFDDHRLNSENNGRPTLGLLPFFHAFGLFVGLRSIYVKVKVVVLKKFEERLFLSSIEKHKISYLPLVPPLAILLAKSPLVNEYDLSSVNSVLCGAAPLSKENQELLKRRLKVSTIRQGYGLTETTVTALRMPINEERNGSSGKVIPHLMCKIRDPETGRSLGPNQVGEICVKGANVMKGYYGNEEATKNAFTKDGWLLTGDLGYYDEDEYFYIVGRMKELIKYKGNQVAPAELEAILLTNPKIEDAAVVGLPNEEAGELPLAFIVPNPAFKITEKEVKEFLAEKVSAHKKLRGGVRFVAEIPKNTSGKILRRKLHEMLKNHVKAKL